MGSSWGDVTEGWQGVTVTQMAEVKELFIPAAISVSLSSNVKTVWLSWPHWNGLFLPDHLVASLMFRKVIFNEC